MPYQVRQVEDKWQLQMKNVAGEWIRVAEHTTQKGAKDQMKVLNAAEGIEPENKCKIKFNGYIGDWDNSFENLEAQLLNVKPNEVLDISINSNGGSYIQAMKMYDRVAQHGGKKRIRIAPVAGSAGAVLALDPTAEVTIPANGLLYHHSPELAQNEAKNPEELRKMADDLEKVGSTLVEMIVARCGKTHDEVKLMLADGGQWFTAEEAKAYGLVDEITPLNRQKTNIRNLVVPDQIVAHVESLNKRSETMALKDVAGKLNIEVTDEMTDEQLEEAIITNNSTLLKKLEEKPKVKEPPKDPPKFSDGILNMLVTNREMEITNLVKEGKITPAVGDELKKDFASKDTILNCVDADGDSVDNFEKIIGALKKNEKVVNFGGRTKAGLPKAGEEQQESVLVLNAKARGAKS
jgi:ATP-dependent protease ClpP protease subunit